VYKLDLNLGFMKSKIRSWIYAAAHVGRGMQPPTVWISKNGFETEKVKKGYQCGDLPQPPTCAAASIAYGIQIELNR